MLQGPGNLGGGYTYLPKSVEIIERCLDQAVPLTSTTRLTSRRISWFLNLLVVVHSTLDRAKTNKQMICVHKIGGQQTKMPCFDAPQAPGAFVNSVAR